MSNAELVRRAAAAYCSGDMEAAAELFGTTAVAEAIVAEGYGEECAAALVVLLRSEAGRRAGDRERLVEVARELAREWPGHVCEAVAASWGDRMWATEWSRGWVVATLVAAASAAVSATAAAAVQATAVTGTKPATATATQVVGRKAAAGDEGEAERRREAIAAVALGMSSTMARVLLSRGEGVRGMVVGLARRGGAGVRWRVAATIANVLGAGSKGRERFLTSGVLAAVVGVAAGAGTEEEREAAARAVGAFGEEVEGLVMLTSGAAAAGVREGLVRVAGEARGEAARREVVRALRRVGWCDEGRRSLVCDGVRGALVGLGERATSDDVREGVAGVLATLLGTARGALLAASAIGALTSGGAASATLTPLAAAAGPVTPATGASTAALPIFAADAGDGRGGRREGTGGVGGVGWGQEVGRVFAREEVGGMLEAVGRRVGSESGRVAVARAVEAMGGVEGGARVVATGSMKAVLEAMGGDGGAAGDRRGASGGGCLQPRGRLEGAGTGRWDG